MKYFVIDGISPFFQWHPPGRINWSKIPFATLEEGEGFKAGVAERIAADFARVCQTVKTWGYTTITLDDLAHLYCAPNYPPALRRKLAAYAALYQTLIRAATAEGLAVWITSDVMFAPAGADASRMTIRHAVAAMTEALDAVLNAYPEIGGIILRIGESDGHDVTGDFLSRLVVKTPRDGRFLLDQLLPVFERHQRLMIFRTWSVGAFRIGDLIWNRETYDHLFAGLASPCLLVSIKYGESDFFRYLRLNPLFLRQGPDKLVELQARREYEGFGEFPSFIGSDYEAYRDQLRDGPGIVGISVWSQTGGWSAFRRLSFLDPLAVWNEINAWTCIRLFRDNLTATGAVRSYFQMRNMPGRWDALLDLLETSERAVKQLLYIDDYAARRIYFRRLRIPPLLAVYWDHLFINGAVRTIHRCFVFDGPAKIRQANAVLDDLARLPAVACSLGLPADDLVFMRDTLALLALARVYYVNKTNDADRAALLAAVEVYRQRHGERAYRVHLDTRPWSVRRSRLKRILRVLVRERRSYRWIDRVFTLRLLAFLYAATRIFHRRLIPAFARKQAMGIDAIFK